MNTLINHDRLAQVTALDHGGHKSAADGMCAMEAAAWIAGEPWSDHPECVSPVIAAFMRSWNDALPDEDRSLLLLPLIPLTIGTRNPDLEQRRATMATDWLIRVHAPAWLRLAGLAKQAEMLASMPEITDFAKCPSLMPALEGVRNDAAAARADAWDAAGDAAGAAAGDPAWAAAWDAAGAAAGAAARDAAWEAAWDAAWAAAWAAARDAVVELQASASDLIRRMCEVKA